MITNTGSSLQRYWSKEYIPVRMHWRSRKRGRWKRRLSLEDTPPGTTGNWSGCYIAYKDSYMVRKNTSH